MTIRIRFRQPAPVARKSCKHCENRRSLFRQEGIRAGSYYALCYKCYQRYVSHAQATGAAGSSGQRRGHRRRTHALETGLMPRGKPRCINGP